MKRFWFTLLAALAVAWAASSAQARPAWEMREIKWKNGTSTQDTRPVGGTVPDTTSWTTLEGWVPPREAMDSGDTLLVGAFVFVSDTTLNFTTNTTVVNGLIDIGSPGLTAGAEVFTQVTEVASTTNTQYDLTSGEKMFVAPIYSVRTYRANCSGAPAVNGGFGVNWIGYNGMPIRFRALSHTGNTGLGGCRAYIAYLRESDPDMPRWITKEIQWAKTRFQSGTSTAVISADTSFAALAGGDSTQYFTLTGHALDQWWQGVGAGNDTSLVAVVTAVADSNGNSSSALTSATWVTEAGPFIGGSTYSNNKTVAELRATGVSIVTPSTESCLDSGERIASFPIHALFDGQAAGGNSQQGAGPVVLGGWPMRVRVSATAGNTSFGGRVFVSYYGLP